tara:strand:- start:174 stop:710 length:537 start_codon:yes stop_codon:yes gene_type:complete
MSPKSRAKSRKNKLKSYQNWVMNSIIGITGIVVLGFMVSGIDRLFFNDGYTTEYPDLSTLITQSSYEKKTGHKIKVEIWNGCGVPKLANMYKDFLRSEGLDVLDSRNADHFNYEKTQILQHRGEIARAVELADIMKIDSDKITQKTDGFLYYDLTLIIGKDYSQLDSYRNAVLHQQPF